MIMIFSTDIRQLKQSRIEERPPNSSPSFAATPTVETDDPVVRINDESQTGNEATEPLSNSVEAIPDEPEVGVGVEPETEAEPEIEPDNTIEAAPVERRTLLDTYIT